MEDIIHIIILQLNNKYFVLIFFFRSVKMSTMAFFTGFKLKLFQRATYLAILVTSFIAAQGKYCVPSKLGPIVLFTV